MHMVQSANPYPHSSDGTVTGPFLDPMQDGLAQPELMHPYIARILK